MQKEKFDFFGDFGPLKTIPRDVIDSILHNLNTKDVKSLGQVNRFFNTVIKNEDEESNLQRRKDLLVYKPIWTGGLHYKMFDEFNIEKVKRLFIENKTGNIPRNLFYIEHIKSKISQDNGDILNISHEGHIFESKKFKIFKFGIDNLIRFFSFLDINYDRQDDYERVIYDFSNNPLETEIWINNFTDDLLIFKKMQDLVLNNKNDEIIFVLEEKRNPNFEGYIVHKIGIKKLNFF